MIDRRTGYLIYVDQIHDRHRQRINEEKVLELVDVLERGACFYDSIVVRRDGKNRYQLINGRHRLEAHRRMGHRLVHCLMSR